jgi:hypothetical protein
MTISSRRLPDHMGSAELARVKSGQVACNGKDYRLRQTPCNIQPSRRSEMDGK